MARHEPVGLVTDTEGGKLLRTGDNGPLAALVGDLIFAGDKLVAAGGATITFLYCPAKSQQTLAATAGGSVTVMLEAQRISGDTAALSGKRAAAFCSLPSLERGDRANLELYASAVIRARKRGTLEADAARPPPLPENLRQELEPFNAAIAAEPRNLAARVARASLLEQNHRDTEALEEYRAIHNYWDDAVWVMPKIERMEATRGVKVLDNVTSSAGPVHAVMVGISKYQNLAAHEQLHYADADARMFAEFLRSDRGGAVQDVTTLIDDAATTSAIRNVIAAKAKEPGTFVLLIAAHGVSIDTGPQKGSYIYTFDTHPQYPKTTALSMAEIQDLLASRLEYTGRVYIFMDVCHAGIIGSIPTAKVNQDAEDQLLGSNNNPRTFGFLASAPGQYSYEDEGIGGGHGVFSYFLVRGLNGSLDTGFQSKPLTVRPLFEYVRKQVMVATHSAQTPQERFLTEMEPVFADWLKPSLEIPEWRPIDENKIRDIARKRTRTAEAPAGIPFQEDLAAIDPEDRARVRAENRGQQILLKYLAGDEDPPARSEYEACARYFTEARGLTPGVAVLAAKELFCRARGLLFDKERYAEATGLLERALRLDEDAAYAHNALGIAYLQQGKYERAILSLRDAIASAPYWAYPRHNLALAYSQLGQYDLAIRMYRQAMALAPSFSYLPYNLGLVYQQTNRRREAEAEYRRAIALTPAESPRRAKPYTALGLLQATAGGRKGRAEAERYYQRAIDLKPAASDETAARQNLALLWAQGGRLEDALGLWRANIALSPDDIVSRSSMAAALARAQRTDDAIAQYREILRVKSDYLAARLSLADLLVKARHADEAVETLREGLRQSPGNPRLLAGMGDAAGAAGNPTEAAQAYREALDHSQNPAVRQSLRRKLKRLETVRKKPALLPVSR